jgi:hypothetical protein
VSDLKHMTAEERAVRERAERSHSAREHPACTELLYALDTVAQLRAENAALRERLQPTVVDPVFDPTHQPTIVAPSLDEPCTRSKHRDGSHSIYVRSDREYCKRCGAYRTKEPA